MDGSCLNLQDELGVSQGTRYYDCRISDVDMQLESMCPAGDVSTPSVRALLGCRGRKRPYYFEEPEQQRATQAARNSNTAFNDVLEKHTERALTVQNSGKFHHRHNAAMVTNSQKRFCTDSAASDTVKPKVNDKAEIDTTDTEDSIFNSFQYWRVPLPELDLSLLQDHSPPKDKSKLKLSSFDDMES